MTYSPSLARDPGEVLAEMGSAARECRACGLCDTRTQVVFGVGDPWARLVVVGEAPGRQEDEEGEPFVGRSGRLLFGLIAEELGMAKSECWVTNTALCRPPNNRNPSKDELVACAPWLEGQLKVLDPKVILAVGAFPTRALLASSTPIGQLRGRLHAHGLQQLVVTYHPAYALRRGKTAVDAIRADLGLVRSLLQTRL